MKQVRSDTEQPRQRLLPIRVERSPPDECGDERLAQDVLGALQVSSAREVEQDAAAVLVELTTELSSGFRRGVMTRHSRYCPILPEEFRFRRWLPR